MSGTGAQLGVATHSVAGRDSWTGPSDAEVRVHAAATPEGLRVLCSVSDDHWQRIAEQKQDWKYDVVDFFLDALPPEEISSDRLISTQNWAFTPTSHHYKVWLGGVPDSTTLAHGRFVPEQWDFYTTTRALAGTQAQLDSVTVQTAVVDSRTRLALFTVPWSHLGGTLAGRHRGRHAFTIGYNDMDADTGAVCSLRWRGSDPYSSESGICSWGEMVVSK